MPLARFQVRNEYGLGAQELYKEANSEEPKAILDGVAVAGLVGILRQLGDLAEFAAEIFHGLQEQMVTTASRSHKMSVRVQRIEAALPPLEKAVLAQTSHIHFAYTAGCEWHPKIRVNQKHFINTDLPHFILDSYEECHDPPRLHLLDKFDTGGPGACLQRYSDPSFFRKAITRSEPMISEKVQRQKRVRKNKKKSSRWRNGEISYAVSTSQCNGRMEFGSPNSYGQSSTGDTISTVHTRSRSEQGDRDVSLDSRTRLGYGGCVFEGSSSMPREDKEQNRLPKATTRMQDAAATDTIPCDNQDIDDTISHKSLSHLNLSTVTWEEKTEIVEPKNTLSSNIIGGDGGFTSELLQESVHPSKELSEVVTGNRGFSSELLHESINLEKEPREAATEPNIDPEDIMRVSVEISETLSEAEEYGEVGSEPDKYADALNILESETETESECQTKREVEKVLPTLTIDGIDTDETQTLAPKPEMFSVNFGAAPYSSLEKQDSSDYLDSLWSENMASSQPCEIATKPSEPHISVDNDVSAGTDVINVLRLDGRESSGNDPIPFISSVVKAQPHLYDKNTNTLHEPQGSLQEVFETSSVNVWTNGGLLGLEPSKPPDQSMSNGGHDNSMDFLEGKVSNLSIHTDMPESHLDGLTREVTSLVKRPEQREKILNSQLRDVSPDLVNPNDLHSNQLTARTKNKAETLINYDNCTSPYDKQGDDKLKGNSLEHLSIVSEAGYVNSIGLSQSCSLANSHGRDTKETRAMSSAGEVREVAGASVKSGQNNIESSLNMLGVSQRSRGNGHLGKESVVRYDCSDPLGYMKTGSERLIDPHCTHQIGKGKVDHLLPGYNPKSQLENRSPIKSPPPSPPLEHMKISFHPMDGFETSKLRLKFPGGHHFHEGIKDVIFPSFQLLPQSATLMQDVDSESDNDTFCRSSLYMSEELMSQHSYSSSEQWESDDTPDSKDHEIYDALHKVSSVESISSAFQLERISSDNNHFDNGFRSSELDNDFKKFQYDSLFDLPSFDSVNLIDSQQETKSDSCAKDYQDSELQYSKEPVPPPPPPLPPVEWRATNPHFGVAENEQVVNSKDVDCPNDQLVLGGTRPSEADPPKPPHINDISGRFLRSKQDQQLLYGSREASQVENFKDMDEREDLLKQIRTKSFNLRPTVPTRSTTPQGPATNNKVAAIIQKANAIRQAYMGTDEGGDENWSDE